MTLAELGELLGLGARGDGIALSAKGPVYVAGALPGENLLLEITGRRGEGRVARIIEHLSPAKARTPACRHFGDCGGCVVQHLPADIYGAWKLEKIQTALERRGIPAPQISAAWQAAPGTRRRVTLAAKFAGGRMLLGFNEARGRQIVDIGECPVAVPEITAILKDLRRLLSQNLAQKAVANIHILAADNGLDLWCDGEGELDLPARERLVAFADKADLVRLSWGPAAEPVVMRRAPRIRIAEYSVTPPPGTFLQATAGSQDFMIQVAAGALADARNIADLFTGVGTFALALAAGAAVHGYEGDRAAVAAFQQARAGKSNAHAIEVKHRDLYRRPLEPKELNRFDAVVIDPPRSGARDQFEALAKSDVAQILSVSCDPTTFARDAKFLIDGGYGLQELWLIDQFLWSAEVEVIGLFARP